MVESELLALQLADTRDWTLKLLDDLSGDDWSFQPAPGMAHPLWLCGHLAVAQHLLVHVRCRDAEVIEDSFGAHFPTGEPVKPASKYAYPSVDEVLATMAEVHEKTLSAIRHMDDSTLAQPAFAADGKSFHPHYRDKRGAISHCSRHEAFHAGQIATIRRLLGKSYLR